MTDLTSLTIAEAREKLKGKEFSALELTDAYLSAIDAANGALNDMIQAGARINETACGFCIGMGQSPRTGAVSLRTNNRNFYGRSGTKSAGIYLVSPEVAAASALSGYLSDPRTLDVDFDIPMPQMFLYNDNLIIPPADAGAADAAIILSSETLFAALFGYLMMGDRLNAAGVAGCVLIFVCIIAVQLAPLVGARVQTDGARG